MGVGQAQGKDQAEQAAKMAISSPLLETSIEGARGLLINITSSPDISLEEIDIASHIISDEAHPDATVIWGSIINPDLEDEMRITVIAAGFDGNNKYTQAEKAAADAARRAAAQSGRIAKLTTGPLAKTGAAVAKVGKVLGPLGVAVGAGASGLEALNRYQSGDTRGAKNTLIGGGVDAALGATSLAAGPFGWGALAGQMAFGGTTFIGKKMGFIDEGSMPV